MLLLLLLLLLLSKQARRIIDIIIILHLLHPEEKKNHYIFPSQVRADHIPAPPREGQLIMTHRMCTLFLSMRQ